MYGREVRKRLVRYEYCCWEEGKVQQGSDKETGEK